MEEQPKKFLQWHSAFYAGIRIELEEENENLFLENEHMMGTKPMQIDVLIIKKDEELINALRPFLVRSACVITWW